MFKIFSATSFIAIAIAFSFAFTLKDNHEVFTYKGKAYKPGDTVYGFKNYIKLVVGDTDAPLILGIPHDGKSIGDPEIPETGKTGRDINTLPLGREIAANFKKSTKKQAWIIINDIARKRVDPNTYPNETGERYGKGDALATYESYHELLGVARAYVAKVQAKGKGALFLDLHGHAHQYVSPQPYLSARGKMLSSKFIDQTELGYAISAYALSKSDEYLNTVADSSSIAAIARLNPKTPFAEIIRGKYSFGAMLDAEGIVAVPSRNIKTLEYDAELFGVDAKGNAKRRPCFDGGYCTRKYGTTKFGKTTGFDDNISSIQAETPGITVRNNMSIIEVSAQRFSNAIVKYLNKWYGYQF